MKFPPYSSANPVHPCCILNGSKLHSSHYTWYTYACDCVTHPVMIRSGNITNPPAQCRWPACSGWCRGVSVCFRGCGLPSRKPTDMTYSHHARIKLFRPWSMTLKSKKYSSKVTFMKLSIARWNKKPTIQNKVYVFKHILSVIHNNKFLL